MILDAGPRGLDHEDFRAVFQFSILTFVPTLAHPRLSACRRPLDRSHPGFFDAQDLVGWNILKGLLSATGPGNFK
jgi:hypothetical protein